jgi:hypothetical protein
MQKRRWVVIGLVVGGAALLLCVGMQLLVGTWLPGVLERSFPTQTPLEVRVQTAQIRPADLPLGWRRGGTQHEQRRGALAALTVSYYGSQDRGKSWVKVSQQLMIYPDAEEALAAYQAELATFTSAWISPPGLEFTSRADEMYIACVPGSINGLPNNACKAVGLYDDTLSILRGNVFEERWLTMADFEAVLAAMDQRVIASLSEGE